MLSNVQRTRLPVLSSSSCTGDDEGVAVLQMVARPASESARFPFSKRESLEAFPLIGWSQFAIQTMVGVEDFVNLMAKMKAFPPTQKNLVKKSSFSETKTSLDFSTDRNKPLMR